MGNVAQTSPGVCCCPNGEVECCEAYDADVGCTTVFVPVCAYPTCYERKPPEKRKDEQLLDSILKNLEEYKELMKSDEVLTRAGEASLNPAELDLRLRQKAERDLLDTTEDIILRLQRSKKTDKEETLGLMSSVKDMEKKLKKSLKNASSFTAVSADDTNYLVYLDTNLSFKKENKDDDRVAPSYKNPAWTTHTNPMASFGGYGPGTLNKGTLNK
jgi:hypothetical protein